MLGTQPPKALGDCGELMQSTKDGKKRKRIKAETWIKLAKTRDEIKQTPNDMLAQLTEDNSKLRAAVEGKAADLYDEMHQRLAHSGKEFTEVGKKQQHRHLTQIK